MKKNVVIVILFLLTVSQLTLQAQTWTGAANDHLWDNPANWDTNSIPNSSNVIISGDSVYCNDDITVIDIDLSSGAVLYFQNTFVEIDDDIVIDETSRFTLDVGSELVLGASTPTSNGITSNGYFLNQGEINLDPVASQGTGGIRNSGEFYNYGSINIESGFATGISNQPTGNFYNQNGDINITCDDDFGLFSSGYVLNNATINLSGANSNSLRIFSVSFSTINSVFTNNGSISIDGPGVNVVSASPGMFINDQSTLSQNGQLAIDDRRIPIHSEGIINNTGTLTLFNGWEQGVDLDGDLTNSGTIDIRNIINVGIDVESGVVFENIASGVMKFTNCDDGIVLKQNFTNNGEIETVNCDDGIVFNTASTFINNGVLKFDGNVGLENSEPSSITTNSATGQVFSNCNFAFGVYDTFNNLGSVELTKGNLVGFSNSSITSYTNNVTIYLKGTATGINSVLDTFVNSSTGRIESESTEEIRLALNVVNEGFMSFDNPEVLFIPQTLINNSDLTISDPTLYAIDVGINGSIENKGNLNVFGSSASTTASAIRVKGEFKNEGVVSLTNAGGASANVFKNFGTFQSVGGGGVGVSNFFGLPPSAFENHTGANISLENTAIGGISIGSGAGFNNGSITGSTSGSLNFNNLVGTFTNNGNINFAGTIRTDGSGTFLNETSGTVTLNTQNSFAISNYGNFINRGILNVFGAINGIICGQGSSLEIDGTTHVKANTGIGIDLRATTTFSINTGKKLTVSDFGTKGIVSVIPLVLNGDVTIEDAENLQSSLYAIECPGLVINGTFLVRNISAGVFVNGDLSIGSSADFRVLDCENTGLFPVYQGVNVNGNVVNDGFVRVSNMSNSAVTLDDLTNTGNFQVFNAGERALAVNGVCENTINGSILIENCQFAVGFGAKTENYGSIYTLNSGSIAINSGDTLINHNEIYVEGGISDGLSVGVNGFFHNKLSGTFTVDAADRYGIYGAFLNQGDFDIGATEDAAMFSQNTNMTNEGDIVLRFINGMGIFMSHDTLLNTATGNLTIKSAANFALSNEGKVINHGDFIIEDCDVNAIRNFNSDGIDNYGLLWIQRGSSIGISSTSSNFYNHSGAVVRIDSVPISINGGGIFTNETCATVIVNSVIGHNNFNNDGLLEYAYKPNSLGTSSWYAGFDNKGVFVERSGKTALENTYTNRGVTLLPLEGSMQSGVEKYNVILQGSFPEYNLDNSFYTNAAATTVGGTHATYHLLPNAQALLADSLYFSFSVPGTCDLKVSIPNNTSTTATCPQGAHTAEFTREISTDWHNPFNWMPTAVPEECSDVLIPSGIKAVMSPASDTKFNKLLIEQGAVFEMGGSNVLESKPLN